MSASVLGFADALRPDVVAFVFLGVLLGYVVGVLPGLNRPAALAIAVPLSYYMSPLSAVAFLIGIAKASGAGGATTAILINTPGEPNAAATALDGYPLAKAGKGEKALKVAKKKLAGEGLFRELKRRRYYEKPSVRRKAKEREAQRRRQKWLAKRRPE